MGNFIKEGRPYTVIYNDMLTSKVLTPMEKLVYIYLKQYGESIFPSMATIADGTGISKSSVKRLVKSINEKGILEIIHRRDKKNGNTSNMYYLKDNAEIWKATTPEELKIATTETKYERMARELKASGKYDVIEKEPVKEEGLTATTSKTSSTNYKNNNSKSSKKSSNYEKTNGDANDVARQIMAEQAKQRRSKASDQAEQTPE